ncbi:hypothetical protein [Leptospira meyeri]|uniref:hypothetical protein n=1 Tax=Leptospira meyeri TaxID=29508 RepID=UPI001082F6F4|nr:hypothetical protein [Leptospira meyeri]TGM22025.1 hypothetical protein EHQ73_09525 [Leptospira meyeri]
MKKKGNNGKQIPPANSENGFTNSDGIIWIREFKHWRSGKLIKASDYGYKAFPIGRKKGGKK